MWRILVYCYCTHICLDERPSKSADIQPWSGLELTLLVHSRHQEQWNGEHVSCLGVSMGTQRWLTVLYSYYGCDGDRYLWCVLPPTYNGASPLKGCTLPKLSMVVGMPPSMERFTIWSKVTSSTVWNWPSLTVSVLSVKQTWKIIDSIFNLHQNFINDSFVVGCGVENTKCLLVTSLVKK